MSEHPTLTPAVLPARRSRRYLTAFAALAGSAAVLALWWASASAERRSLSFLPETERIALYERTLRTLRSTCAAPAASGLEDFCREQAHFVLNFPECDAACTEIARQHLRPTR